MRGDIHFSHICSNWLFSWSSFFCGTSSYTPYTRDKMLSSRMGFSMTSWKIGNGYMSRLSSHDSSHSRLFTLITILIEIDDHRMFPTWPTATSTFTCSAHWVACCSHWWWLWGKFCHCSINMRTFLVSLTSLATSLTNFCIIIYFISYKMLAAFACIGELKKPSMMWFFCVQFHGLAILM